MKITKRLNRHRDVQSSEEYVDDEEPVERSSYQFTVIIHLDNELAINMFGFNLSENPKFKKHGFDIKVKGARIARWDPTRIVDSKCGGNPSCDCG